MADDTPQQPKHDRILAPALYVNMAEALRAARLERLAGRDPLVQAMAAQLPPCTRVYQALAMYAALRAEGYEPSVALRAAAWQVVDHLLACGE